MSNSKKQAETQSEKQVPVPRLVVVSNQQSVLRMSADRTRLPCQNQSGLLRRAIAFEVRHPPRSGWLDEWGRLKGGHLLSLGVALKRACINSSELPACSIRGFLLADVLANLFQFKADRRDGVAAGPEMLARKIPLLATQPGNGDRAFPFQKPDHGSHRVLRGNRNTHIYMVRHQMPFDNLALLCRN